jgi:hypothetical protein
MHPHTFASSTSSFTSPSEASSFAPGQTLASTFPSPLSSSFVPALASPFPPLLQSSSTFPSAPSPASFLPPPPASSVPSSLSTTPSFMPALASSVQPPSSSSTPSFLPPPASSVPPSSSSLPLPRQTVASHSGRSISSASTSTGTGTGTGKRKSDGGGVSDRASKRTNTNKDSTSQNLILLNSVQGSLGTIVDSLRQVGFTPEANIDAAIRMVQSSDLSADDQSVLASLFSDQPNKAAVFRALDPGEVRDKWVKRELEKYRSL